ncbi:hypothetical protein B0H19DRAFT_1232608 [Mycena capillaripes]|nr:hypothetical protein B0H19DRAFT_1232608 [Mycena capillaripes]
MSHDIAGTQIEVRFPDRETRWCQGMPEVADSMSAVEYSRSYYENGKLEYNVEYNIQRNEGSNGDISDTRGVEISSEGNAWLLQLHIQASSIAKHASARSSFKPSCNTLSGLMVHLELQLASSGELVSFSPLRELWRKKTLRVQKSGDEDPAGIDVEGDLDLTERREFGFAEEIDVLRAHVHPRIRRATVPVGLCSVEEVRRKLDGTGLEDAVDLDGVWVAQERVRLAHLQAVRRGWRVQGSEERIYKDSQHIQGENDFGLIPVQSRSRDGSGFEVDGDSGGGLINSEEVRSRDGAPESFMAWHCELRLGSLRRGGAEMRLGGSFSLREE